MGNLEHAPSPEDGGLVSSTLEKLIAEEYQREAAIVHSYGTFDKVYQTLLEYLGHMFDLPPTGAYIVRPYREVGLYVDAQKGPIEIETGGGIQIAFTKADELGRHTFGIRVPVYELSDEGTILPLGGLFDDKEEVQMVAALGDDLDAFASRHDILLQADLTIVGLEQYEPTLL